MSRHISPPPTPISDRRNVPHGWSGAPGRFALNLARQFELTHKVASRRLERPSPLPADELADPALPKIVVGPLSAPSGLGQAARLSAAALNEEGHETYLVDVSPYFTGGRGVAAPDLPGGLGVEGAAQLITFVNGDYVPFALSLLGQPYLKAKHLTANLAWELPRVPQRWQTAIDHVHDIWVPSRFTAAAVRAANPDVPISVRPHPVAIEMPVTPRIPAPDRPYTFGFSFSMHSGMARKNPMGLIDAFTRAFGQDETARLSIHVQSPEAWTPGAEMLRARAQALNIELVEGTMARVAYLRWLDGLDAFVSLHRAEGFGLTLAEAMLRGLPVIATGWSGNVDFMTGPRAYHVPYDLVEVEDDHGVTPRDCGLWAEPVLSDAARILQDVSQLRPEATDVDVTTVRSALSAAAFVTPDQATAPASGALDKPVRLKGNDRPEAICKLCSRIAQVKFGLPATKRAGYPIPDAPDDCWYYECSACDFLFTPALDDADHTKIYGDWYWENEEEDWYGRTGQSFRLVTLANELLQRSAGELEILDFGCGTGAFLDTGRNSLQLDVWGTDINPPKFGAEWFLTDLGDRRFDVILACEVIEHLPDPRGTFEMLRQHLKPRGVIAFQTATWDPKELDRDWWYLGPSNGHISLYADRSLSRLFEAMGGEDRRMWRNYAGVQAWLFA